MQEGEKTLLERKRVLDSVRQEGLYRQRPARFEIELSVSESTISITKVHCIVRAHVVLYTVWASFFGLSCHV